MRGAQFTSNAPWRTILGSAIAVAMCASLGLRPTAQQKVRLNHIIENLEQGKPVILEQDFRFLDMEHSPFQMDRLESLVAETGENRNADGRLKKPPIARIPQDGDEDFRWSVKQFLDSGVFGIFFPHIESKDQAMKAIRAMRYPPQSYTKQPEPRGERGYGPTRAVKYWGLTLPEYLRKADVWPLNPEGELFAVMMIETAAGVQNIKDIVQAPGVGAIMLATMDLTMSLGIGPPPSTDPKLEAAYQTVLKACLAQKTIACGCSDYVDKIPQRLAEGWKLLARQNRESAAR